MCGFIRGCTLFYTERMFKVEFAEEYTKLFNAVSDTIIALEKLTHELRVVQLDVEEKILSKEEPSQGA